MARCPWHADRIAVRQCGTCGRPVCAECAVQVAESPEAYYLCPECLGSLETLVERGLRADARAVTPARTAIGAIVGATVALSAWLLALHRVLADPAIAVSWTPLVRWIGYLAAGVLTALAAVFANGSHRADMIPRIAVPVAALAISAGQYVGTNMFWRYHITTNPDDAAALASLGLIDGTGGWWLPVWFVSYWSWQILTWKDYAVIIASLWLAYALSRPRRLRRLFEDDNPSAGRR